jgi:broad specificity phosphatase PhoE
VDTARPLAEERGLAIRLRDELKEIDYGRYQGMLKNERPFKLRREHQYAPMPGGESLFDVYRRIGHLCEELRMEIGAGRTLAAFGHFWSNRILVGVLLGVPFEEILTSRQYKPANGSVYEIVFRLPRVEVECARWIANEDAGEEA